MLQQFDSTIPNLESFLKEVAQGCQKGYNKLVGIEASNPASGDPLEGHQKVSLEVRLCAETVAGVPLVCDPMVLTGALHCLIGNAVSAMRLANSPKLFVRLDAAWERSPSGNFDKIIVIRVTDVGPGIRSEIAPFIFLEGFSWRNQAAETKPVEETKHKGRGLPIARSANVGLFGRFAAGERRPTNRANLARRPGRGHFRDSLWRQTEQRCSARIVRPRFPVIGDSFMATILIADDDPKQRGDLVRAALQADFPPEGIVEAKTEEEANELVETQAFNVALVDIMLSEPWGKEEGLRVIAKLKALQPDCRVIALTTKLGGTEVGVRALEVGRMISSARNGIT